MPKTARTIPELLAENEWLRKEVERLTTDVGLLQSVIADMARFSLAEEKPE